ncbi:MAG: EpsG family protein [Lachnospiraceae bacterium]|nr:EpsG family protein [Lachnospiraceae bacterium]
MKMNINLATNKKRIYVLFVIAILWLLYVFSPKVADRDYYLLVFTRLEKGINYHNIETGYWLICKFAVAIGMSFNVFIKIYAFIGLMLMTMTALKYSYKPYIVFGLYFLYPFMLDVAQVRHFMACAILTFAIRYLEKLTKENLIKYCLCIAIAMTQHTIALVYLVFLLVYVKNSKTVVKIAIPSTFILLVGVKFVTSTTLYLKIMGTRGLEDTYEAGTSGRQFVLYLAFYGLLVAICYLLHAINSKRIEEGELLDDENGGFLYKVCMISALLIPFIVIDFQFTRLFRGCIFIVLIYIVNQVSYIESRFGRFAMLGIVLLFMAIFYKLFGPSSAYFETLTEPIIFDNEVIKLIGM